jgi:hypothetical protein
MIILNLPNYLFSLGHHLILKLSSEICGILVSNHLTYLNFVHKFLTNLAIQLLSHLS